MTRVPLIAGNWKMNGSSSEASLLVEGICQTITTNSAEVLVCPPYPYLALVGAKLAGSKINLGAQNVSQADNGAFTGEVSATMLTDLGCRYVIVGHSERREMYAENSQLVIDKALCAARHHLNPIVCVGETLAEREAGRMEAVIAEQMAPLLACPSDELTGLVIAYEPVWAIGTGKTASPEQAQEVHAYIRRLLLDWDSTVAAQLRILYGGSMKPENAGELLAMADVDGGLVGGAALNSESFVAICNAV